MIKFDLSVTNRTFYTTLWNLTKNQI